MDTMSIKVVGSRGDLYSVELTRFPDRRLRIRCSCEAGRNRRLCHHRTELLSGDFEALTDAAHEPRLIEFIHGSDLREMMEQIAAEDRAAAQAESRAKSLRRKLGRVIDGN